MNFSGNGFQVGGCQSSSIAIPSVESLQQMLDALVEEVAVIAPDGEVALVNKAWSQTALKVGDNDLTIHGNYFHFLAGQEKAGNEAAAVILGAVQRLQAGLIEEFKYDFFGYPPLENHRFRKVLSTISIDRIRYLFLSRSDLTEFTPLRDAPHAFDHQSLAARERGRGTQQERLGLFDTPPGRREIRLALVIAGMVFAVLLAVLPVRNAQVGPIAGFMPALNAAMLVCDLITAAILYAQAVVFRSRALTVLASGYVFGALLLIPYALTFPGAFSANGLLGAKLNTTGWIAVGWRLSVPTSILLYAWLKQADASVRPLAERPPARVLLGTLMSVTLAVLVTLLATLGHDLLPPFFINHSDVIRSTLMALNAVVISLTLAAMAMLFSQTKSVLDMWLLVALFAWLAQSLLNAFLHSRFGVGAYAFLGLVLASNLTVMLALVTESIRLYARLALSTATRDRERDARLISMDAVAAAIDHEVGQPLTATKLSASVALSLLTGPKPDADMAIKALRDSIDSSQRTFDVIKSVRAMFTTASEGLSEFSLNELVRETALLLDRELAAKNISLRLTLDDALPSILANRIQIQRVLINLLTNAIEAVAATQRQTRSIAVRSTPLDGRFVLLHVNDSGNGIALDKLTHIFEPFFTTKSTGTGLGLSLSRTIIEEHGGRLWASAGDKHGATFHVQLPLTSGQGLVLPTDCS